MFMTARKVIQLPVVCLLKMCLVTGNTEQMVFLKDTDKTTLISSFDSSPLTLMFCFDVCMLNNATIKKKKKEPPVSVIKLSQFKKKKKKKTCLISIHFCTRHKMT